MTLDFRDGEPDDAPAIDTVFRTSFCDTFGHLYRDEDLRAFLGKFALAAWRRELSSSDYAFRLAEKDGQIMGYAKLGPPALPVNAQGPSIELRQLYLLRQAQGLGIGRMLTDWAIGEARRRGAAELFLTVYTDNHRARSLYARYGFEDVGPFAFMVGEQPDEDIIMRLAL